MAGRAGVTGADDVVRGLSAIARDVADLSTDTAGAAADAARLLLDTITPRVPRRTGRLAASGRVTPAHPVAAVWGGELAPYAAAVYARTPFTAAGTEAATEPVAAVFGDAVAAAVKRHL